jgi:hypothetical protein
MDGQFTQPLKAGGGEPRLLWASFAPNGSSDPSTASNEGPPGLRAFTTTYAATGAFTVTLPVGWTPVDTPHIFLMKQCESLTEHFDVCVTGSYNAATRSFVIQAHRNGTGREIAAHADARIGFAIAFNNSTGG